MKNILSCIKHSLFLPSLLLVGESAIAQNMPDNHQMSSPKRNIFLAMMDSMMVKMDNAPAGESTGVCFILQMIPHHQGAIEMANYEIQHGKDFTMIQLAKSILTEQTYEIQQMKLWLKLSLPDTVKTTADFEQNMNQTMTIMMQNMPANNLLNDIDQAFAKVMIPHHQAAIDMAKVLIKFTTDHQTNAFAKNIISSQQIEIGQMSSFLKN